MNTDMEEYYATNKFYLSRVGGWPYQHKVLKVLLPCLLTIVQYSFIVTQLFLLHDTWGDMDVAIESIITIVIIVGSNTKLINIVVNDDKFRRLLQFMNNHWEAFNIKSERHILRYYADIGRKVTNYYTAICYIILLMYLLIPLIPRILDIVIPMNESRPLIYVCQVEYRVDKEKYYYSILFHVYLSSIITIGIILTVDTTYIVCVLHTCSLFTAISHRLENIIGIADADNGEKIYTVAYCHLFLKERNSIDADYDELTICLKKHQLALEHVQTLDSIFSHVTFVLLFLNVLIMSLIGIQLINKFGHTEEIIRYICVTIGVLIHLICMCFPGQLLMDRSAEVFDKAYSSRWYTFSIKSKKLLRVLLYRSLVPCTLSAGKLFIMSMTTCSSMMQTALSYFTTFLSMK